MTTPNPSRPAAVDALRDDFNGNTPHLIRCIEALLSMDADGVLRPHGVGDHARTLLSAAAVRLAAHHGPAAVDEVIVRYEHSPITGTDESQVAPHPFGRYVLYEDHVAALAKPAQEAAPRGGGEAVRAVCDWVLNRAEHARGCGVEAAGGAFNCTCGLHAARDAADAMNGESHD